MEHTNFQRSCASCGAFRLPLGGGVRVVNKFRQWVCEGRKKQIDKAKHKNEILNNT